MSSVPTRRAVAWWLFSVAFLVAMMVTLGGLTRLTGSGLSITEWRPVTGIIPPLTHQVWVAEFAKYQHIPQYWRENRGMSLSGFQSIFWWEWTHRFLGRLLGAVFLLPFVYFALTGTLTRKDWPRLVLLFTLGALQGFVGWWMVESGLETRVSVSQYRLAIHLGVAIVLFGALLWTALEYLRPPAPMISPTRNRVHRYAFALAALIYIQMLLGALVAGLHAGLIYNTWPSMNGRAMPDDAFVLHPWWRNFFENPGLAQFDHRMVAYLVGASVVAFWFLMRRSNPQRRLQTSSNVLLGIVLAQIALGVATLLNQAPLVLAALHQATAVALFAAAIWNAFECALSKRGVMGEPQQPLTVRHR